MLEPSLLGDPHLGRQFKTGVPLSRRGMREQTMRQDFARGLRPAGPAHICMGDLFDDVVVSYGDVLFAAATYRLMAAEHPGTTFYILQGNHDKSRDAGVVSAWDVFCALMDATPNVVCVVEPMAVVGVGLLLPWHPFRTAVEQLETVSVVDLVGAAYGHWDTDPRGSHHNLIPTAKLAELGFSKAYTGHVHKPDQFVRDGVDVTVVGSMQPYAQGEDGGQGSVRYRTFCLNGLEDELVDDRGALRDTCVRLRLAAGEQWDGEIPDCWSWNVERARLIEAEEEPEDASMDGFDTARAGKAALDEHEIIPEVRAQIDAKWQETFGRGFPE